MLRALLPQPSTPVLGRIIPPVVQPLVDAGTCQESLTAALQHIAQQLGFDGFVYGVATSTRPT